MQKETHPMRKEIPEIVAIVGKSGSGKTTLLEKLIPALREMGLRVGTIKHDVHGFEIDHPGKDSWRHKKAGSVITIISSPRRIGMVMDVDHDHTLDELASFFSGVDLILTEGYKQGNKPKIEIFRREAHAEPLCLNDSNLIALMTNADVDLGVPRFALHNIEGLAHFLSDYFNLHAS